VGEGGEREKTRKQDRNAPFFRSLFSRSLFFFFFFFSPVPGDDQSTADQEDDDDEDDMAG
jgi:hypothetical protein